MPAKKKTETHYHEAVEAQGKSLAADVASLSLSIENIEKSLAELNTIDDLTETPEPPKTTEIQAVWDALHDQWPSRF